MKTCIKYCNGWLTINHEMNLSASTKGGASKTEVFTMNYKPNYENQQKLF
ncbi:MAG: hypothetical protein K2Q03_03580 [Sphingobacteriaceae bacterium]|nr:hypothetical protein [Sphingobacteriaceae bacterium]